MVVADLLGEAHLRDVQPGLLRQAHSRAATVTECWPFG
jgi:hypothetical protein